MKATYLLLIAVLFCSVADAQPRWKGNKDLEDTLSSVSSDTKAAADTLSAILNNTVDLSDTLSAILGDTVNLPDTVSAILNDTVDMPDTLTSISTDTQLLLTNVQVVDDSLSAVKKEIREVEKHIHGSEYWFGRHATQAANTWALSDTLGPFVATSGAAVWGADAADTVKVFGTDDTPHVGGMVKFDVHRVLISAVTVDTPFYFRLMWHETSASHAVAADQYTEVMFMSDVTNPQQSAGQPVDIMCPRLTAGTIKMWAQCLNATDNATMSFFVGIHEYDF